MAKRQKADVLGGNFHLELIENMANNALKNEANSKKEKKAKFQMLLNKLEENVRLTENQKIFSDKIINNTITIGSGVAGTSKTFTACYSLLKCLFKGEIEKIIITKPIKESGENLGFLPGTIDDKMAPYLESFIHNMEEILGEESINWLLQNGFIEGKAIAYMRGSTFNKAGMFLDEGQNLDHKGFMVFITRIGKDSKIVVAGDVTQRDIEEKKVVMHEFIELFKGIESVAVHEFKREDIVRNKILIEITDRYEEWKSKKGF